jgi:hypothetical protein
VLTTRDVRFRGRRREAADLVGLFHIHLDHAPKEGAALPLNAIARAEMPGEQCNRRNLWLARAVALRWHPKGFVMAEASKRRSVASRLRRYIERLGPYQSLALVGLPVTLVEPLKLAAVAIVGSGHWITGLVTILCAYAASLFLIERLFKIVKPKLLTLPWFARLWNWLATLRRRVVAWISWRLYWRETIENDRKVLAKQSASPGVDRKEGGMMTERQFRELEVQIARYRLLEREVTDPLAECLLRSIVVELEADLRIEQSRAVSQHWFLAISQPGPEADEKGKPLCAL